MVKTDLTLKSSGINGGVAVELNGVDITYKWNNYVNTPDVPSKFAATDAQVELQFLGWTNPTMVVKGIIDINNLTSNQLTIALLKLFAKEKTNAVYITEKDLFPTPTTSLVLISSFDLKKSKDSDDNENRWDYSILLIETL
jgi:hypothetical protein